MRISLVSHEFPPIGGGGATALEHLAEHLAQLGHSVQVLSIGIGDDIGKIQTGSGVEVIRLAAARKRILAPGIKELLASCFALRFKSAEHISRFAPDIICAFFAFPAGLMIAPIAHQLGVPLAISLRGSDVPGFSKKRAIGFDLVLPFLFKKAAKFSALAIANGHRLEKLAAPYLGGTTCTVIPNGVDTNIFHPHKASQPTSTSPLRLLYVGQFIARKRCLELVDALAGFEADAPEIHLTLVGSGPLENELRSRISSLPTSIRATIQGHVQRSKMPAIYCAHHALVLLSKAEGVSNALLEGLASGNAVLASRGAVDSALKDKGGIVTIPKVNGQSIRSAIRTITAAPETLEQLQTRSRQAALDLCWSHRAKEYARQFSALVQS